MSNTGEAYSPVWVLEQSIVNVGLLSKTTDLIAITLCGNTVTSKGHQFKTVLKQN